MPDIAEFIDKFRAAVDFREAVDLRPDTELASLAEWDSLAALSVIVMFDMEFGKAITGNDLKACKTLAELRALAA